MYHLRNKDNRTVLMYDNITRAKEQALSRNLTLVEVTSYDCVLMERVDKGAISDGR